MNLQDTKYSQFALCREMMEIVDVVQGFDPMQTAEVAGEINSVGRLLLTG